MNEISILLFLAHFLGDFTFQSNRMARNIEARHIKTVDFYYHIIIHLVLLLSLTQFRKLYFQLIIVILISHIAIDIFTKTISIKRLNNIQNLLFDQLLHGIAIIAIQHYFFPLMDFNKVLLMLFTRDILLILLAISAITSFSSILIKKMLDHFQYDIPQTGMKDAGKYIGICERLFIFFFVFISYYPGIAYLLAAKSIYRFNNLKESQDIKLTEYMMLGTFVSFGIALLISTTFIYLKEYT